MKKFYKSPLMILALGLLVIGASSVGATRAALVYQEIDNLEFKTAKIQVEAVGDISGEKLEFPAIMEDIEANKAITIGKVYPSDVSIHNISDEETSYSEYVRVVVRKSWKNGNGSDAKKNQTLDPRLIQLTVDSNWIRNPYESSGDGDDDPYKEQEVYYLKRPLACDETVPFITGIKIDDTVATKFTVSNTEAIITNIYDYQDQYADISLQIDAVQTNNGKDAIYGAWGVDVTCDAEDEGNITAINPTN